MIQLGSSLVPNQVEQITPRVNNDKSSMMNSLEDTDSFQTDEKRIFKQNLKMVEQVFEEINDVQ